MNFTAAEESDNEVRRKKKILKKCKFICRATKGVMFHEECKTLMVYDDYVEHVKKHHEQNQYKC